MKNLFGLVVMALLFVNGPAVGQFQTLEPDNYPDGTVLNNVFSSVSLITAGTNNQPHPPVPFDVTAAASTFPFAPPTGSNVFAHAGVPFWNTDRRLRMDFNGLVSQINISFQGGNSLAPEFGRLEAYSLNGTLLASAMTGARLGGEIEVLTITRTLPDIAWAVAYSDPSGDPFGRLDRLVFTTPVLVPEPSTGLLVLCGSCLLLFWRRRN